MTERTDAPKTAPLGNDQLSAEQAADLAWAQESEPETETDPTPLGFTLAAHPDAPDRQAVLATIGLVLAVAVVGAVITGIAVSQPIPERANIVKIDIPHPTQSTVPTTAPETGGATSTVPAP